MKELIKTLKQLKDLDLKFLALFYNGPCIIKIDNNLKTPYWWGTPLKQNSEEQIKKFLISLKDKALVNNTFGKLGVWISKEDKNRYPKLFSDLSFKADTNSKEHYFKVITIHED